MIDEDKFYDAIKKQIATRKRLINSDFYNCDVRKNAEIEVKILERIISMLNSDKYKM